MTGHAHLTPAEIRAGLKHQVIDGDGHWVEYDPVFAERMRTVGGDKAADADQVLAVDDRITWRAGELRTAGLGGGTDEIRARAYLDLLLAKDSRPRRPATPGGDGGAAPGRFEPQKSGQITAPV